MKQNELTKAIMMITKWKYLLVSMVYTKICEIKDAAFTQTWRTTLISGSIFSWWRPRSKAFLLEIVMKTNRARPTRHTDRQTDVLICHIYILSNNTSLSEYWNLYRNGQGCNGTRRSRVPLQKPTKMCRLCYSFH